MTSPAAPSPQSGVGNVHKSGPVQVVKRGTRPKPMTTVKGNVNTASAAKKGSGGKR